MRERLSVTIPDELIKRAKELAAKEDRTLSGMVAVLIREGLNIKECEKEKAA
jgi:metal-responsive CopG/Arc/MetJ family transcriptional regulator